jgi:hypothetical protein
MEGPDAALIINAISKLNAERGGPSPVGAARSDKRRMSVE